MATRARPALALAASLLSWSAATAYITLTPRSGPTGQLSWCIVCGEFGTSELLLNVLLFLPLGVLFAATCTPNARLQLVRWSLIFGTTVSLMIEGTQWAAVAGRVSALGDLIANASGALFGSALYCHRLLLWAPHGTWRRRLIAGWLVVIGLNVAFGYWSSTPWLPEGRWYLQRTPVRPWSDVYAGELEFAGIGAVDVPSDRIRDTALINGVRRGDREIVVVERIGPPTERLAYVLRLVEADRGLEVFSLARVGDHAVLHSLTNAARARLGSVGVRSPAPYARIAESTLRWQISPRHGTIKTEPIVSTISLPRASMFRGWTGLVPRRISLPTPYIAIIDGLWGLLLLAPLLRWAALRERPMHSPH